MPTVLRNAYTAVIARGELWEGSVQTEPYEAAWAGEAVFFVHVLEASGSGNAVARVQISPDGMHWVDEGGELSIPAAAGQLSFGRVANFGGWLRLSVNVPPSAAIKVVATLALKA
jgi:hypothetical protein